MNVRRILVLDGHPVAEPPTFCRSLARAYAEGAREAGHEVREIDLAALDFDPLLAHGFHRRQELEPDLKAAQEAILWCQHLVVVHPVWWGSLPARFKGFLDRAFLPGFAFRQHDTDPWWDKLLAGRSARVLYTTDQPDLFYRLVNGAPTRKMLGRTVLGFCGFKPVRFSAFAPVRGSSPLRRDAWLAEARELGLTGS